MWKVSWLFGMLIVLGLALVVDAAEVESNCSMCHQQAPVPASHPSVAETSVQSCGMCHAAAPQDGYFSAVHFKHASAGLDCSSCHGNAADEALQQQLNSQLGK